MLITFCIAILIISIVQLFLLRVACFSDGLKCIAMREAVRYLMVVPVFFMFILMLQFIHHGDLYHTLLLLSVCSWSSYYLSFGMRNRAIVPSLNFIISTAILIGVYYAMFPRI